MITIKFCSVCGKELVTPIKHDEKICDEKIVTVYCYPCWTKTKNGFKIVSKEKYFYSDENLEVWK